MNNLFFPVECSTTHLLLFLKKNWFGVPFLLISRFVFFGFALLSMGLAMHDENTKPMILFQAVLKPSNLIMYRLVLHSVWSLCFVLYLVLVEQVLIIFMIKLWSKQDSSRCVETTMCEQHQGWFGILFLVISDDCALSCFGSAIAFPPYVCMCVHVSIHIIINKSMLVFFMAGSKSSRSYKKKIRFSVQLYDHECVYACLCASMHACIYPHACMHMCMYASKHACIIDVVGKHMTAEIDLSIL